MTAAEFLAIAPDGKRYELIDGEFIAHTTPPVRHQSVLVNILSPLSTYCRGHDSGGTITSPLLPGFALNINVIFDL